MTTQAKHTPGLAHRGRQPKYELDESIVDLKGDFIADCAGRTFKEVKAVSLEERKANARLIAAAPEMAEELLGCLDMLEATNGSGPVPIPPRWAKLGPNETFRHIRAVLQKAGVLDGGI